jgi:hypothetical protein
MEGGLKDVLEADTCHSRRWRESEERSAKRETKDTKKREY